MKSIEAINTNVTVIGLGQMGTTLASLLLKSGYTVTIWNRTKSKGEILIKDGAKWAENIAAAVQASDTIVICVFDYAATQDILYTEDVTASLTGKTIIQLTTGSPTDAIESEAWAQQHGAYYIDGAIQVAPEQMGKSNTTIFISGQQKTFSTSKTILNVFGGNIKYLGEKISAASAMDLASLSYLYGSLLGFFMPCESLKWKGSALTS
jgi:3-hydroxyisobutyrate dehydrogenase-like beta-hydroxyacid dehydrogenase